jgi:hypothetical protein
MLAGRRPHHLVAHAPEAFGGYRINLMAERSEGRREARGDVLVEPGQSHGYLPRGNNATRHENAAFLERLMRALGVAVAQPVPMPAHAVEVAASQRGASRKTRPPKRCGRSHIAAE